MNYKSGKTMNRKNINSALTLVIITLLTVSFNSCGDDTKKTVNVDVVLPDMNNATEVKEAIDLITKGENWTQARYEEINSKISQLAGNNILDKDLSEEKHLYEYLFSSSAVYLSHRVDSTFKTSTYNGVKNMQNNAKFLQTYLNLYVQNSVDLENPNKILVEVNDIINNYYSVLNLSKYYFGQKAVFFKDYSQNYIYTQRKIENNKYYAKYFCHNTAITSGVKQFPSRQKKSHAIYMNDLEQVIEEKITTDSMSFSDAAKIQSKFYHMSSKVNKNASDKLDNFIDTHYAE